MEITSLCRTCLSNEAHKDISELKNHSLDSCSDIVLFCLNIKVEENSKVTKLCLTCFKKIMSFYKFKLLALKNDAYLKTTESKCYIKNEIYLEDDIKREDATTFSSENGDDVVELKTEPLENENDSDGQSDDELLSVIKQIKDEFVSGNSKDEAKEISPAKPIKRKRGRPPNINGAKKPKAISTVQVCEECGKSVKNLKEHSLLHLPKNIRKRYPCKQCNRTFATCGARNKHKRIKHLGLKKSCPYCGKSVVSVQSHILMVHKKSELRHECAPCGRRFISRSALDAHTTVHTKDRPHQCDQCDKKFRSKNVLALHRRQVHFKEKSHLCQFCSKRFFKKHHLQVHLRSHTKEKPYQCSECHKSFASSTILNNHRTTHSKLKLFECTLCTMTFARSGYLRAHMLSHTKEKKHPCSYCGIKFLRSDHRKRHEHTAHERHLISNLNTKDTAPIIPKSSEVHKISVLSSKESLSDCNRTESGLGHLFGMSLNVGAATLPPDIKL